MRRTLLLVFLALGMVGATTAAAPRIAVDSPVYAYPDTVSGIAVVHEFILSNVGDQDLVIGKIDPSCGCTTTQLSQARISPRQSVTLRVVFETDEYWGPGIRRDIAVPSNDPTTPNLVLTLTGTLLRRADYQKTVSEFRLGQASVILDVRDAGAYAAGHLRGAVNVPASQAAAYAASLPPGALVYCYDQDGTAAAAAVAALRAGGVTASYAICDGISRWGQQRPWSSLLVAGSDSTWGRFLDVSGSRASYASSTASCKSISGTKYYVLIDLRSPTSFAERHLAGAVNLTESSALSLANTLPADTTVILYSDDGATSDRVAETLSSRRSSVYSLLGGLTEWQKQWGSFLLVASAP